MTTENTNSDLKVHTLHYANELLGRVKTFLSKTFTNSLNMQKQYEKNVWETSNDTYLLSVRVQTKINFISICFLPQYQRQRKCFSSERKLKKALRDTRTRAAWYGLFKTSVVPVSQRYVIKQMVNAIACTIELWMHLGGLLSTQEASFVPSNLPCAFITQ